MSESEKIKEKPPIPPLQEKAKEPSAPKTSQSAFDKVLEQQKILSSQNPILQGKVAEQGASEQKVKEITRWQEGEGERRKRDDRDETSREKTKQKEKGSEVLTRSAVIKAGERRGSGGGTSGGGGRNKGGFGSDVLKRHVVEKKLSDIKGFIAGLRDTSFAGKLVQKVVSGLVLDPKQMQAIVNQIVQAIRVGKDELGQTELRLILREHIFSGLRLRFTSKHGKVAIHFETARRDVKDLFTKKAANIQSALEEKGVAVEEIKIT